MTVKSLIRVTTGASVSITEGMLAEFGLTAPQYAVLALLAENPGITNAELSDNCTPARARTSR